MRTRFKSLLALGLTFAAGCFVGIVIGSSNPRWFKSFRQPPGPDRAVEHLTKVLELTPEQQEQVREVFIRLHPEFLKESERAKAFRRAFIIKHFNEMAPLLDERQKAVAQEFLEKQLSRKMPPPPKRARRTSALPLRFKKTLIASVPPGDKTGFPFRECRTVD